MEKSGSVADVVIILDSNINLRVFPLVHMMTWGDCCNAFHSLLCNSSSDTLTRSCKSFLDLLCLHLLFYFLVTFLFFFFFASFLSFLVIFPFISSSFFLSLTFHFSSFLLISLLFISFLLLSFHLIYFPLLLMFLHFFSLC